MISWLDLERYQLGELDAAAAARVKDALQTDAALRAKLETIAGDARPMPPLKLPTRLTKRSRWPWLAAPLAAAAALVLYLHEPAIPPSRTHVKGGELALEIVRDREGTDLSAFVPGDRFKAFVTCPPGERGYRFVVTQGNESVEALDATAIDCGNRVALPGAFTLTTPEPAIACVSLRADTVCVQIGR